KRMDDRLFQFIQWEDEEPYEIAELIEEYEHKEFYDYVGWKYAKSEETEVNKDIQWLKREIHKELESWHGVEGGIDGDGINEIMLLINQLDEPETLSEDWIQEHSYNVHLLGTPDVTTVAVPREDLQNLLVPKKEVLSQEWISENVEYAYFDMLDGSGRLSSATAIIKPEKLQNLLVLKQEEVDRAYKDGYEKGRELGFYKGYREGLGNKGGEPEVLSQECIDKYKVDYDDWTVAVPIVHLQNLLVPKKEVLSQEW